MPEYDRLGLVREPMGTHLKGIAPSNIFKSRDNLWMVIAANQDGVFRRLCDAMGRPELADDPRFATHVPRGENQEEIEGIVAEWAAQHDASEIDRILNEAGVVCGPIYTMAEIFEDPQYKAREMLVEHVDPEFGPYIGPGHRPQVLGHARRGAVVGDVAGGQPQRGDLLRPARPHRRRARRAARGWRRMTRHHLRRRAEGRPAEPAGHARARRARRARRPARRGGRAAHRGRQLRQPEGACRRWPERRRSSRRSSGATGSSTPVSR